MNNNRPPALGYGVILSRKYSSAYASMLQVLYIAGLDRPW